MAFHYNGNDISKATEIWESSALCSLTALIFHWLSCKSDHLLSVYLDLIFALSHK